MKYITVILLIGGTLWDGGTTFYGTYLLTGKDGVGLMMSIGLAIALSFILLNAYPIVMNPSREIIPRAKLGLWIFALCYDLGTAFKGHFDLLHGDSGGLGKIFIAIGFTVIICSAPLGLSYMYFENPQD